MSTTHQPFNPLDAFTREHLAAWADRACFDSDERDDFITWTVAWLTAMDTDDQDWWFDRGWTAVYDQWRKEHDQ